MKNSTLHKTSGLFVLGVVGPMLASSQAFAASIQTVEEVTHPESAIHKRVELYGALRVSVDYSDSDVSSAEASGNPLLSDGGVSVSSNTSIIGFRGEVPYRDGYTFLWQYEQQVDIDDVDPKDTWTTRDSFLGLSTPVGSFLVGRLNTPYKNMSVAYAGYFNTTVGEPRSVLSAPSVGAGGRLGQFAANSINWKHKIGDVGLALQYSADQASTVNTVDDNDGDSYGAWIDWKPGPLRLGAAYMNYSDAFASGKLEAYSLSAKYTLGKWVFGGIFEDIDAGGIDALARKAYGVQLNYTFKPRWIAVAQWNHAEETPRGDDEADQYSAGIGHSLSKQVWVYGMYTTTQNGDNAAYRGVDYAHGDKLGTLPGRDPWSFSLGAQLKF